MVAEIIMFLSILAAGCSPCPRFHVLGQEAMELHNPRSGRLALRSSTMNCFCVTGVTGVPNPDAGLARRSTTTPHIQRLDDGKSDGIAELESLDITYPACI